MRNSAIIKIGSIIVIVFVVFLLRSLSYYNKAAPPSQEYAGRVESVQVIDGEEVVSVNNKPLSIFYSVIWEKAYPPIKKGDSVLFAGRYDGTYFRDIRIIKLDSTSGVDVSFFPAVTNSLQERIGRLFPEPYAHLIQGMVFGINEGNNEDVRQLFKQSGLMHILVASGYNISFIIGTTLALRLLLSPPIYVLALSSILLGFCAIAGFGPPIIRAFIMGMAGAVALLAGRKANQYLWLIYSASLMIFLWPEMIGSLSFQLSVASTLGVIVFSSRLNGLFIVFPALIRESLSSTVAAQLLTLPITFFVFKEIYLESLLVNTLVLSLVPYISIGAVVSLISSYFFEPLGARFALFPTICLRVLVFVAEFVTI